MTYEEFLAQADEDTPEGWVDGEVILTSPASQKHQRLVGFLTALLQHFVEINQSGVVLSAPFQMRLAARPPGREPDVLFVSSDRLDRPKEMYLDGPADLAVEVVSADSRARDRVDWLWQEPLPPLLTVLKEWGIV